MKVLIKAMRPHRQKVLTEDGEEMRLQQWANKTASAALRTAGGEASGEQFTQARDALMREAVANPQEHGLKFMGERMPFEGQTLEESLSEPDVEGEQAAVDQEFAPEKPETPDIFDEQGKLRDNIPDDPKVDDGDPKVQQWQAGKLDEEKEEFDPDAEAEHLRRIMTSRDVAIRDAWSVLKFGYPSVAGGEIPEKVRARHNVGNEKCPIHGVPLEEGPLPAFPGDVSFCPACANMTEEERRM